MNKDNIVFIGMDTHKVFCENAYCLDSRDSIPQPLGRIPTTKQTITKLARQIQSKHPRAWQAQLRLCRRYQRLMHRGKHRNVVVVATARELVGFVWEIIQRVPLEPVDPKQRTARIPR